MVFVFAIVSCEQLWAQEIAEDENAGNPLIFEELVRFQ